MKVYALRLFFDMPIGLKLFFPIPSCHSLFSHVLTHNFVLSLSGAVIALVHPLAPLSLAYHLAAALFKYLFLCAFKFMLLLCVPLSHPITFLVFTSSKASSCHRFMSLISLISLSVSTESSTTTPSVWTPWINLYRCCPVQTPLDHKICQ